MNLVFGAKEKKKQQQNYQSYHTVEANTLQNIFDKQ